MHFSFYLYGTGSLNAFRRSKLMMHYTNLDIGIDIFETVITRMLIEEFLIAV